MRHGGDLSAASRSFGRAEADWLDLSTGINPRPWPLEDRPGLGALAGVARLPSPAALEALLATARQAYGVPAEIAVAAAPGTEVLIRMLPRLLAGATFLLDTSYRSYGEAWRSEHGTPLAPLRTDAAASAAGNIIAVNPNNPDGRRLAPAELLRLARSRGGRLLVVDEAYADAEDGSSIVPHLAPDDPVLVLKSFGKFFGLPGLRLGFAIGRPAEVSALAARLGDWPVSAPALAIGTAALADEAWQAEARRRLAAQAARLQSVLQEAGLTAAGGCRLFRLAGCNDAAALHRRLARAGIWTRIFDDRPGVLRLGLPADDAGLARLSAALRNA